MPIFNNQFSFIHIPKCGGTSIECFLRSLGWRMSLFTDTGAVFINGHTPQHCTYRELQDLNLLTEKVFAVVRPEVDRCISEYFYIRDYRPDLGVLFDDFDSFLDLFLDRSNLLVFDYHNLPNREFLINREGVVDPCIEVIDFFDIPRIESYLGVTGLSDCHMMKSKREDGLKPDERQFRRITDYFNGYGHKP